MTDTTETLKAALADLQDRYTEAMKSLAKWTIDVDALTARVAAFEKARVEKEEPPVCSEVLLAFLERGCDDLGGSDYKKAAAEIRYLRGELARLREGLKMQERDIPDGGLEYYATPGRFAAEVERMAIELQRHCALLKDGGGK